MASITNKGLVEVESQGRISALSGPIVQRRSALTVVCRVDRPVVQRASHCRNPPKTRRVISPVTTVPILGQIDGRCESAVTQCGKAVSHSFRLETFRLEAQVEAVSLCKEICSLYKCLHILHLSLIISHIPFSK